VSVRRRVLAIAAAALLALPVAGAAPASGQGATRLTFSVREARAYAYRVSLSKEVIEAAQTLQPCDPETDPYQCDDAAYEHAPNCPKEVAIGPGGRGPEPKPAPGVGMVAGGSGDAAGAEARPPLASPITLNEQLTLGALSHLGSVVEANGLATDGYVDLSGRQDPSMHTESDAFSPNRAAFEERCAPPDNPEEYAHFVSRSTEAPSTYHLAECREGECTFGGLGVGADSEEGRTIVHLFERDGRLHGELKSSLHDVVWAGGSLEADLLDTTIEFSTDGTPGGLEYSVGTTALGVRLGGEPIQLPPGRPVELPGGVQIGIAAPFATAAEDGSALSIVAAGLYFASDRQTVLFGGAEVRATMGREPVPADDGDGDDGVIIGGSDPDVLPGGGLDPLPTPAPTATPSPGPVAAPGPADPELAVSRVETGRWIVPFTLGAGLVAALLLLLRWVGRYPWGRRLHRAQPFRGLDWLYRAFVKS
jgi:hypothetical protein